MTKKLSWLIVLGTLVWLMCPTDSKTNSYNLSAALRHCQSIELIDNGVVYQITVHDPKFEAVKDWIAETFQGSHTFIQTQAIVIPRWLHLYSCPSVPQRADISDTHQIKERMAFEANRWRIFTLPLMPKLNRYPPIDESKFSDLKKIFTDK